MGGHRPGAAAPVFVTSCSETVPRVRGRRGLVCSKPPGRCRFGEECCYRATCTFYHGDGLEQPGILGVCACEA